MLFSILLVLLWSINVQGKEDPKGGPPPFFLQDTSDGMCLGGEEFKRCGIDTLFYVVGSPGSYQIHKRPVLDLDEKEEELCIAKKLCDENSTDTIEDLLVTKCTHCGAKRWNILGDANTGYVLSENDSETCVIREKGTNKAMTSSCDSKETPYATLQLQFASKEDINLMNSRSAKFISAAAVGDLDLVKSFLSEDDSIEVNTRDWDQITALIPASAGGFIEVVKILIGKGADVNAADKDGVSPLMESSIMNHIEIVKFLLANGAKVDATASSGVTALWLACGEGNTDIVNALMEAGALPNVVRSDGVTCLMTAASNGHVKTVQQLLEAGADPYETDADNLNCLTTAAEKGKAEVLKILVEYVEKKDGTEKKEEFVNHASNTGFTALIVAAAHGHFDAVKFLVDEAKENIDYSFEETNVTALMYASAGGHADIVSYLVDKGANVNHLHSNLGSSLFEASSAGFLDVVKILVEKGALVEILDKDGVSALMSAASQGKFEVVKYLLNILKEKLSSQDFEHYLNRLSDSGGSALMFAAAAGSADATKILIEYGANIDQMSHATPQYLESLAEAIEKDKVPEDQDPHIEGVTSLHVAAQNGFYDTLMLLLGAGAKVDILDAENHTPLYLAVKGNHGDCAIELVKAKSDPNTPYVDDDGETHNLLMDAIIVENEEFAKELIKNGANLYYQDEQAVTTLLQASHRNLVEVVDIILQHYNPSEKPDFINIPSDEGISPLIASSSEGHINVVKRLLATENININARDKDGTTAIMAASARGHEDIVHALIESKADINVQNVDGHTALMFAYNGKTQVETLWERYDQFFIESKTNSPETELKDGGTGPIIEEALNNHTNLVQALINAGADQSLKDKEGHLAKDFDFHPDIDSNVLKQEEKAEASRDKSKNEL